MFREIVEKQQAVFFAKQSGLIEAMGDNFKGPIARMAKMVGVVNYGNPPFIVDDGEDALLLIDESGKYSRLPPDFNLSEDAVKEGHDTIYSVPVPGIGLIRFLPANGDYEFHEIQAPSCPPHESDGFFESADKLFATYIDEVMSLAKKSVARSLNRMKRPMLEVSADNGMSIEDVLREPGVINYLFPIFALALTDASAQVTQRTESLGEQTDEDTEQE